VTGSAVRLVALYPELLGTYGDGGNVLVLEQRLRWRGIPCEVIHVPLAEEVPRDGDLYLLGGGEDEAQLAALNRLLHSPLVAAIEAGAHLFGVCAGLQLLGTSFSTFDGTRREGLGLLDVDSDQLAHRAIGEVTAAPDPILGLPILTGFENHGGRSVLGPGTFPLARVVRGVGNGGPDAVEGAYKGRVMATYLHGPVLARNPALADLLLEQVLNTPLTPLELPAHEQLRQDRLGRAG
jgi:CobQ-like glutamine amidotransferase family enzyme